MNIDFTKVDVQYIGDLDMKDYPDFCDAYIEEALVDGEPATEEQLDAINDNADFVYEEIQNYLF